MRSSRRTSLTKAQARQLPSTGTLPGDPKRGVWPTTDDGKLVITQSMVSGFVGCPREVYYGTVLGLRPRLVSKPLTRGTWVHALLEERDRGGDWRAKHQQLIKEATAGEFEESVEDLAKECERILLSYEHVYRDDDLTPVAVELTVERPMFKGRVLYRGRIDLIVMDSEGSVWLVDHKTHATLPDWRYRELAFQHYSYLWAVAKAPAYAALRHNGKPLPQPKGFIYNYCKTGSISVPTFTQAGKISRQLKPGGTTLPVFKDWLHENGLMTTIKGRELLAITDPAEKRYVQEFLIELEQRDYAELFRRDYLVFDDAQAARQHKSFVASAKRLLQYDWTDPDAVERNLGACSSFTCNYKDLTVTDLMHGTSEIEQRTRYVKTRDPLDYYPNQNKKKGKATK